MTANAQAAAIQAHLVQDDGSAARDARESARTLIVQRGPDFLIRIATLGALPEDLPLEIRLGHIDGRQTVLHQRSLSLAPNGDAFKCLVNQLSPGASKAMRRRRHRLDLTFPAGLTSSPVASVEVVFAIGDDIGKIEWLTKQGGLE